MPDYHDTDWEEEQFGDYYDPAKDCPRCCGSGEVPTEGYESYTGNDFKECPMCNGTGES